MPGEDAMLSALKTAIKNYQVRSHKIGKAINVTDSKCDVVIEGEPIVYDVRLHAIDDTVTSKIITKPTENSLVVIGILDNLVTEAFIEQCSEIDEVIMITEGKEYRINNNGHLIKGGEDTLKEVIELIIEAVQFIVVIQGRNPDFAKLIQAKQKLDNILQ